MRPKPNVTYEQPARLAPTPFAVSLTVSHGSPRVSLRGELDIATAPCLELELDRAERTQPDLLLVDLHEVKFIDLRGIRVLLAAHDRACARGGGLALLGASAGVQRLLRLAGVDQLLHLIGDPASARPRGLLRA